MAILQNTTVSGSLVVTGNLTARQYILSSSVSYFTESFASGSTRFGDSMDDTMQVTGSLLLTGSMGLSVTPSAWNTYYRAIQISAGGSIYALAPTGARLSMGNNHYNNSSNQDIYLQNDFAAKYVLDTGTHNWYTANAGTAGGTISWTQAMVISGSNVGIGTTSPDALLTVAGSNSTNANNTVSGSTANLYAAYIRQKGSSAGIGGGNYAAQLFNAIGATAFEIYTQQAGDLIFGTNVTERMRISTTGTADIRIGGNYSSDTSANRGTVNINGNNNVILTFSSGSATSLGYIYHNSDYMEIWNRANGYLAVGTNNTERMRITSGGNLEFTGATANSKIRFWNSYSGTPTCVGLEIYNASAVTSFAVNGNGGAVYTISLGTGLVYSNAGSLTNTNPSDERLKDNITDISWGLSEILKLRPVSYHWKNDEINQGLQYGFIAQEVQDVMPELVKEFTTKDGENDVIRLGLEKEGIYATLVKAIQELKAENDSLKEILTRNNIA